MSSSEGEDLKTEEASSDEEVASVDGDSAANDSDEVEAESDEEGTAAPEVDVNASATESDEDDDDDDDDGEEVDDDKDAISKPNVPKTKKPTAQKVEELTSEIKERYQKRQAKQLYIRFPEKLPVKLEDFQNKVKALSPLIVDSHKPRQKHARFCLVDFANTEDRNEALKQISKTTEETKIVVSLPKCDGEDFIQTIVEKKLKQIEKKRAKGLLRRQNKKQIKNKQYVSTIVVLNIPRSASTAQIKELFPNAVDIQLKMSKNKLDGTSIATITLPSSTDAKANVKRKLELGGNKLNIRFESYKKNQKRLGKSNENEVPQKGPLAPKPTANKKQAANGDQVKTEPQVTGKKRLSSENGSDEVAEKKIKVAISELDQKPQKQGAKGKKNFPPKKGNPPPNKQFAGGKPNKQNKQKNQPQKKGKAAAK